MHHSPQTLKTIAMSWCAHTGTQSASLLHLKLHMLKIWMEKMERCWMETETKNVTLARGGILGDWKKPYFAKPQRKHFFLRTYGSLIGSRSTTMRLSITVRCSDESVAKVVPRCVDWTWKHCAFASHLVCMQPDSSKVEQVRVKILIHSSSVNYHLPEIHT